MVKFRSLQIGFNVDTATMLYVYQRCNDRAVTGGYFPLRFEAADENAISAYPTCFGYTITRHCRLG